MEEKKERRKSKRTDLESTLLVKRLDSDTQEEVDVDIMNVSKTGIGFYCSERLEIGAVYNASLTLWTKEVIQAFIGMPEAELQKIDTYNMVVEAENKK